MSKILRVQWTIVPQIAPQPWLTCNRCGGPQPFRSSGKIRINANGKRLDAWLIYNCARCENTWNRPVFERRNIRDIDPSSLRALQTNDPDLARRLAFDVEDLRRRSERIEEFAVVQIQKQALSEGAPPLAKIEILLCAPLPTGLRADRLLATEFGISRARIHELEARGRLTISPYGPRMLRRAIRDGMRFSIEVSATDDDIDPERATGRFDSKSPP